MKNIFILNPASGKGKHENDILFDIRDAAKELDLHYDVYFTKGEKDASRYVREYCKGNGSEYGDHDPVRFYGCGGDGTLNELVNGAAGFDDVEIGIIPRGTGNDYVRNYGDPSLFKDIRKQLLGRSVQSDLIHYRAQLMSEDMPPADPSDIAEGFCANMFNIGFDSDVVSMTDRIKKKPLISGSMAYLTSVFIVLARKKEIELKVEYPGEDAEGSGPADYEGNALLLSIANGCFCGGGIKGVPRSRLDDGLMDVSLVKGGVSRSYFVKLFPKYRKGTHLEDPRIEGVIDYRQVRSLVVSSRQPFGLCVDGEISPRRKVEFEVIPGAFRFIVPEGADLPDRT